MTAVDHDLTIATEQLRTSREALAAQPTLDAEVARQRDVFVAKINTFAARVAVADISPERKIVQLKTVNDTLARMLKMPDGLAQCSLDLNARLDQFANSEASSSFFKELWDSLAAARAENYEKMATLSMLPPRADGESDADYSRRILLDPSRRQAMADVALGFIGGTIGNVAKNVAGVTARAVEGAAAKTAATKAASSVEDQFARVETRTAGAEASRLPDAVFLKMAVENGTAKDLLKSVESYRQSFKTNGPIRPGDTDEIIDIAARRPEANAALFGDKLNVFSGGIDNVILLARRYSKAITENPQLLEITEIQTLRTTLLSIKDQLQSWAAMVRSMRNGTAKYPIDGKMERAFPDRYWNTLNQHVNIAELNQLFNAIR